MLSRPDAGRQRRPRSALTVGRWASRSLRAPSGLVRSRSTTLDMTFEECADSLEPVEVTCVPGGWLRIACELCGASWEAQAHNDTVRRIADGERSSANPNAHDAQRGNGVAGTAASRRRVAAHASPRAPTSVCVSVGCAESRLRCDLGLGKQRYARGPGRRLWLASPCRGSGFRVRADKPKPHGQAGQVAGEPGGLRR